MDDGKRERMNVYQRQVREVDVVRMCRKARARRESASLWPKKPNKQHRSQRVEVYLGIICIRSCAEVRKKVVSNLVLSPIFPVLGP